MSWTLDDAKKHLAAWLEADLAVSTGQEYRIGGRSLTRADASVIAERISFWRIEVARLESGHARGVRVIRTVPKDM
jgi:hypothetical protein